MLPPLGCAVPRCSHTWLPGAEELFGVLLMGPRKRGREMHCSLTLSSDSQAAECHEGCTSNLVLTRWKCVVMGDLSRR